MRDPMTIALDAEGARRLEPMVLNFLSPDDHHGARSRADQTERDREGPVGGRLGQAQCGRLRPPRSSRTRRASRSCSRARKDHWRGAPQFQKIVLKFVPSEADRVLLLQAQGDRPW